MNKILLTAKEPDRGKRVDSFLAEELEDLTRSYLKKLIDGGAVTVNGKQAKAGIKLKDDDEVVIELPDDESPDIMPEDIPLDILYEDDDILIVNKPKGMVVHPAAGHYSGTLVNALLYHLDGRLSGINGVLRPGIVHRIDKNTTGSLIICKNDAAHKGMAELLAVHDIDRKYLAIVHGHFNEEEFTIDKPIGRSRNDRKKMAIDMENGRRAVTHVKVLQRLGDYSLVECTLETGRTHQIRVHLASIGHPVLGDDAYGPKKCPVKGLEGQCLHAYYLGFKHPCTGQYISVNASVPAYFTMLINLYK